MSIDFKTYLEQELLNEANYEDMFVKYKENSTLYKIIQNEIDWAKKVLKKQDRIVWYLRIIKLYAKYHFLSQKSNKENAKKEVEKDAKILDSKAHGSVNWYSNFVSFGCVYDKLKKDLEHYISQNIPDINNVTFNTQNPPDLFSQFEKKEKEYKEKFSSLIPETEEDKEEQTIIIEFNDGWRWINLNKSYCDKEGNAMGHCGNVEGQYRQTDRILSLRQPVKVGNEKYWQPHLTFILMKGGILGETKGKANTKPAEKYHKYIVPLLLKKDLINGINSDAGYLPESNFRFSDLSKEYQKQVLEKNPVVIDLIDLQKMGETEAIKEKLKVISTSVKKELIEPAKGSGYIFIEKYNTFSDLLRDVYNKEELFDEIDDHVTNQSVEYADEIVTKSYIENVLDNSILDEDDELNKRLENYYGIDDASDNEELISDILNDDQLYSEIEISARDAIISTVSLEMYNDAIYSDIIDYINSVEFIPRIENLHSFELRVIFKNGNGYSDLTNLKKDINLINTLHQNEPFYVGFANTDLSDIVIATKISNTLSMSDIINSTDIELKDRGHRMYGRGQMQGSYYYDDNEVKLAIIRTINSFLKNTPKKSNSKQLDLDLSHKELIGFKTYLKEVSYTDLYGRQFKEFIDEYKSKKDDPSLFVQFTNFNKDVLEKNPYQGKNISHEDPIGVYGYPLKYVIEHPADIYYGSAMKYLRVLKNIAPHDKTVRLDSIKMEEVMQYLDKLYQPEMSGEDVYAEVEQDILESPFRKKTNVEPGLVLFWCIQRDVTSERYKKSKEKYLNILPNEVQTKRLRNIGIDVLIDLSTAESNAIINPAEKQQIIFLTKSAFSILNLYTINDKNKNDETIRYRKDTINFLIKKIAYGISRKFNTKVNKVELPDKFATNEKADVTFENGNITIYIDYANISRVKMTYDDITISIKGKIGSKKIDYMSKPEESISEIINNII